MQRSPLCRLGSMLGVSTLLVTTSCGDGVLGGSSHMTGSGGSSSDVTSEDDPPLPVMCDEPPRTPSPHDVVTRRVDTPNIEPRRHNGERCMSTSNQLDVFPARR